jgi:hypothetical protein
LFIGFIINLLQNVLNAHYEEVKKCLVSQAKNTGLEQRIEEAFESSCKELLPFMTSIYEKLKDSAYSKIFQQASTKDETELNKLAELNLSSYTNSSLENSIKQIENSTDEFIRISLSGIKFIYYNSLFSSINLILLIFIILLNLKLLL